MNRPSDTPDRAGGLRRGALLALLALALGMAWAAAPAAALPARWEEAPPVRLLAPAAGTALTAGETAEIAWEPAAPLEARIVEWEAFLSLDGGATYPVRLTPHLDIARRRTTFRVPDFPSADVRLLLRMGDEEGEAPAALPQRFSIVSSPAAALGAAGSLIAAVARPSLAAGEPALPGQAGVVAWAEGSPEGGTTREVAAGSPAGLVPAVAPAGREPEPALGAPQLPNPQPQAALKAAGPRPASSRAGSLARSRPPRPAGPDLLLLLRRRNE